MFVELILFITSIILLTEGEKVACIGVIFPLIHLTIFSFKHLVLVKREEVRLQHSMASTNTRDFNYPPTV